MALGAICAGVAISNGAAANVWSLCVVLGFIVLQARSLRTAYRWLTGIISLGDATGRGEPD
jgi:hypothetical protein